MDRSQFDGVEFRIADLDDARLGLTLGTVIWIDVDAAGHGWFVDASPADDVEFSRVGQDGELWAADGSPAGGAMDLLTVVGHELGHVLGLDDHVHSEHAGDIMAAALDTGARRNLASDTWLHEGAADNAKFFVVDVDATATFRYSAQGLLLGNTSLGAELLEPRGVDATATGELVWIVNNQGKVAVYDASRVRRGDWRALCVDDATGIAADNGDLYLVDASQGQILKFNNGAARTSGMQDPSDQLALHPENAAPNGLATDGERFWVVDSALREVFVYEIHGAFLGRWQLDPRTTLPTGITDDPSGAGDLWVVDRADNVAYQYRGATEWLTGDYAASQTFTLDNANTGAEGIADPVVVSGPVSVAAALVNDTATSGFNADNITADPTIVAAVGSVRPLAAVRAGFDSPTNVVTTDLADGTFLFDRAQLEQIFGGPLPDGPHSFQIQAEDEIGRRSEIVEIAFDLDSEASPDFVIDLAATSDTEPVGDLETTLASVTLTGATEPSALVVLEETGAVAIADQQGVFGLNNVALSIGVNAFTFRITDVAGNSTVFNRTISRVGTGSSGNEADSPLITATLVNDTGLDPADKITADPTISGVITDESPIVSLRGTLNQPLTNEAAEIPFSSPTGQFTLTQAQLRVLAGGKLPQGHNTLRLRAADSLGNIGEFELSFEFDSIGPSVDTEFSNTMSQGTEGPTSIDVMFSEPVTQAAFALESYSLVIGTGPDAGKTIDLDSIDFLSSQQVRLNVAMPLRSFDYVLQLPAGILDRAGNPLRGSRQLEFTVTTPVAITEVSPFSGEEMVSLTRDIVVRFSDEIDADSLGAGAISLIANGIELPGTVRVSSTNRFATFFSSSPLPPSTEVRILIDGDQIVTRGGQPIDANGDGIPGGIGTVDFRTLPLTRIEGTNIFGYVFDSLLKNADGTDVPLVGATIRVDAFPEANAVTDENGFFELVDMPAPEFFVHIDGSTATHVRIDGQLVSIQSSKTYPSVGKPFHSLPGQRIQLSKPPTADKPNGTPFDVYLPRIDVGDIQSLNEESSTGVTFGTSALADLTEILPDVDPSMFGLLNVEFPAGSAVNDDGVPATRGVIVPVPPDRIPAPLPGNVEPMNPPLVISIQAPGATSFDVPAPITFPNLDELAPGEKSLVYTFNHDAGRWEAIGAGTVSEDGLTIVSDEGVGIRAPGWHVIQPGVIVRGNLVVGRQGGLLGRTGGKELASQTGRHYYALQNLDSGFVIRGSTDVIDRLFDRTVLSANANYRLSVFGLVSGQIGSVDFRTPDNGAQITAPIAVLDKGILADTDGDLLDDRAEFIIGTRDDLADTDGDGIRDRAELLQGLNPFNSRPYPTGIISELPLAGAANELVVEGSTQSSEGQVAYVATSAGLAVLDVTEFDNPIVLGQLDLGNAVDVSVDSNLMIAAVATTDKGLQLVDVSDPMLPIAIESVDVPINDVEVIEGVAYSIIRGKAVAYDLQTGDLLDKTLAFTSAEVVAMDREANTLYFIDSERTMHVVDASAFSLEYVASLQLPKQPNDLFAGGGKVYAPTIAGVGLGRGGYMTIDVSDPTNPQLVADGFTTSRPVTGSGIDFATNGAGLGLVIGGESGVVPNVLDVFNTTAPFEPNSSNPEVPYLSPNALLTRYFLPDRPRAVEIASGVAYTATGNAGIVVTNYKSFDSGGVAPTVELTTSLDVDPATDGIQVEEGKKFSIDLTVNDVDNPDPDISDPNNPGPAWIPGRFENGLFFDFAGGDAVRLPGDSLSGLSDATIEFWYRTPKAERQAMLSGATTSDPNALQLLFENDTTLRFGETTWTLNSISDNQWHHYAIVRNQTAGEVTLYVDGVSMGTETASLSALAVAADGLFVGQQQSEVGGGFSALEAAYGTLDELRFGGTRCERTVK